MGWKSKKSIAKITEPEMKGESILHILLATVAVIIVDVSMIVFLVFIVIIALRSIGIL